MRLTILGVTIRSNESMGRAEKDDLWELRVIKCWLSGDAGRLE